MTPPVPAEAGWQMVTPVALAAAPAPSPPPSADHAGLVERFIARAAELSDGGKYRWWADLSTALQQSAERIAGLERDINRYAWERDKAREERDAAERRAEAFWKPQLASRDAEIERLTRESSDWSNGDLNGVKEMGDFWRAIGVALFGWRYVCLTDFKGHRCVRRVKIIGGRAHAAKYKIEEGYAELLDEGETRGISYIKAWEPYEVGQKPQWPIYTTGRARP